MLETPDPDMEAFLPDLVSRRRAIQALNKEFEAEMQKVYRHARLAGLGPYMAAAFVSRVRHRVNAEAKSLKGRQRP